VTFVLEGDPNLVAILPLWLRADVFCFETAHAQAACFCVLVTADVGTRTVIAVGIGCGTTGEGGDIGNDSEAKKRLHLRVRLNHLNSC
jgi:hypothetical protein